MVKKNVIKFPLELTPTTKERLVHYNDQAADEEARKVIKKSFKDISTRIKKDESITGLIVIGFKKDGRSIDWYSGDLGAAQVYMTFDKIKMSLMNYVKEELKEAEDQDNT